MLKISLNQLRKNWMVMSGTFLILLVASLVLSTFTILLGNSIYAIAGGGGVHLQVPAAPVSIFGSMAGISFFIAVFALYNGLLLSLKLRWRQFLQLRIIGATYNAIRRMLLLENLFLAIITIAIGVPVGIPISQAIIHYLQHAHALEADFAIYRKADYQGIYAAAAIVFILITTYAATLPLKHVQISSATNPYQKTTVAKTIMRVLCGGVALGGAIALSVINPILKDGLGTGMIICAVMCYTIAFAFLGKYFVYVFLWIFRLIFYRLIITHNALTSIMAHLDRTFLPIALVVGLATFGAYSINIPDLTDKATIKVSKQFYNPDQKNILFQAKDEQSKKTLSDWDEWSKKQTKPVTLNYLTNSLKISFYDETHHAHDQLDYLIIGANPTSQGHYQQSLIDISDDKSPATNIIDTLNNEPQLLLGNNSDNDNFAVGDKVKLTINGKDKEFKIAGSVNVTHNWELLPEIYLGANQINTLLNGQLTIDNVITNDSTLLPPDNYHVADVGTLSQFDMGPTKAISLLATIIIAVFSLIVLIDAIFQYFFMKTQEYQLLRVLGYYPRHLYLASLIEGLLISGTGTIFALLASLFFTAQYSKANYLGILFANNPTTMAIFTIVLFLVIVIVCVIPTLFINRKLKQLV